MSVHIEVFFHKSSWTLSYVVVDEATRQAAIIDPALDFDYFAGSCKTEFADKQISYIEEQGLQLKWILETHAHADHLTAAQHLKQKLGGQVAIGEGIKQVQSTFKSVFNLGNEFNPSGEQFDLLLNDGDKLSLGDSEIRVMATPGHTNDSVTYLIDNNAFIGDTLFMPDSGSARCDFPGGDAELLYQSVEKLFALPDDTVIWVCHDYQPGGRELRCKTTVAEQKAENIHVKGGIDKQGFVETRETRDATLAVPKLIIPSVQVNIRAGHLPDAESDGGYYLKVPLNKLTS